MADRPAGRQTHQKIAAFPGQAPQALALGTEDYEGGDPAVFNMAVMGLRLAQRANGVSKLHGDVSRHMFGALWPGFDADDVPIASVTNGVHAPTWTDPQSAGSPSRSSAPPTRRRPTGPATR